VQRLAQELLGHVRAVGVGGVEQVDTEIGRPAQHGHGACPVGGRTPYARAGEPHRAEAETVDRTALLAAQPEAAGRGGGAGVGESAHPAHDCTGPDLPAAERDRRLAQR
jgi:hypothetical protein